MLTRGKNALQCAAWTFTLQYTTDVMLLLCRVWFGLGFGLGLGLPRLQCKPGVECGYSVDCCNSRWQRWLTECIIVRPPGSASESSLDTAAMMLHCCNLIYRKTSNRRIATLPKDPLTGSLTLPYEGDVLFLCIACAVAVTVHRIHYRPIFTNRSYLLLVTSKYWLWRL